MKATFELSNSCSASSGSFQPATPVTASNHGYDENLPDIARHDANTEPRESRVTDRGAWAWLAVVAGFVNFFAGFGILNSWGTFQVKYLEEPWAESSSLTEISWIGSVQPGLLFFLGGIAGYASDKVSAALLSRGGTILFVASYLLVAEFGNNFVDHLALQGVISDWFDRRRGLALGICASGSSLGGIFWPILIEQLHTRYNIKRALQGVALIPLIPLLIASCLEGFRSIKEPRFIALSVACFFIYGGMLIPFNYIPLFAVEHGYHGMAQYLLAICYSGSIVGRIGTGALADSFGTFNVLCAMAFLTGTLTMCWITMTSLRSMVAFAVLYGLFSGGLVPLGSACVAKITPISQMNSIGFRIGFMMMICSFSAFGGGPMSGYLLESNGDRGWMAAFFLSGMSTITGGALILAILALRVPGG